MGCARGGLQLLGAKQLQMQALQGYGRGDAEVRNRFQVA
jgi:hypothetical protein